MELQWNFAHVNSDDHMQPKSTGSAGNEESRARATNPPMRTARMHNRPACGWNTHGTPHTRRNVEGTPEHRRNIEGTSKEHGRTPGEIGVEKQHCGVDMAVETPIIYVNTK